MTKRLFSLALIVMMIAILISTAALAERETAIKGEFVNGSYVIRTLML